MLFEVVKWAGARKISPGGKKQPFQVDLNTVARSILFTGWALLEGQVLIRYPWAVS